MRSSKFSVPVINVGNLSMGGTGKTPHIEYLIRLLKDDKKVATLSRGFGRKQRGFIIADESSDAEQIGDEPLQFYKKFGNQIIVSVEANRVLGAMDLFRQHDDVEVLLLDDAYQHRSIYAGLNILLTDYNAPFYQDLILPVGNLRESRSGKNRADIIIVTKCPDLSFEEKERIQKRIQPAGHQKLFFSRIAYGDAFTFKGDVIDLKNRNVIVVSGIANATPFIQKLEQEAHILKHFNYIDHHTFKPSDLEEIHNIFGKFAAENPLIVTTEKDAMRLMHPKFKEDLAEFPWVYQTIQVEIEPKEEFDQLVKHYVEENN